MRIRLLKVLFVVLILLTIGEAGYYFYYLYISKSLKPGNTAQSQNSSYIANNPTPVLQFPIVAGKSSLQLDKLAQSLEQIPLSEGRKFRVIDQQTGIIRNLQFIKDQDSNGIIKMNFTLAVGENNSKNYSFDKNILGIAKIYKINDKGYKETIDVRDLKEGDQIKKLDIEDFLIISENQREKAELEIVKLK